LTRAEGDKLIETKKHLYSGQITLSASDLADVELYVKSPNDEDRAVYDKLCAELVHNFLTSKDEPFF
jgi:hypothetical protein